MYPTGSNHFIGCACDGRDWENREMTSTLWKCEQLRAGQIYNQVLFNSQREAEQFMQQMSRVEPDMFWRLQAVAANAIWN
jgi:hypothetical protein